MAYQDTVTHPIIANVFHVVHQLGTALAWPFRIVGKALVAHAECDARLRRVEHLRAKTDAELTEMNLKREDIVRHVYQNMWYL